MLWKHMLEYLRRNAIMWVSVIFWLSSVRRHHILPHMFCYVMCWDPSIHSGFCSSVFGFFSSFALTRYIKHLKKWSMVVFWFAQVIALRNLHFHRPMSLVVQNVAFSSRIAFFSFLPVLVDECQFMSMQRVFVLYSANKSDEMCVFWFLCRSIWSRTS